MSKPLPRLVFSVVLTLGLLVPSSVADAATTHTTHTTREITPTTSATPDAKAWIIVDAETGAVLASKDAHESLPPASVSKMLTALTVVANIGPDAAVPVSQRAADMPPRKISMQVGDNWTRDDMLHALLMSSANDAAMALAERVSGSGEAFGAAMTAEATALGLQDHVVAQDPAGLDDDTSIGGGNQLSVRDLAIVGRAILAEPTLANIVSTRYFSFDDPHGGHHRLVNHNELLWQYPGAIGFKTGYTEKAQQTYAGAAERNGRTIIVVLEGGNNPFGLGKQLLDQGFATPSPASPGDILPAVHVPEFQAAEKTVLTHIKQRKVGKSNTMTILVSFIMLLLITVFALRMRVVIRQRNRRLGKTQLDLVALHRATVSGVASDTWAQRESSSVDVRAESVSPQPKD